MTVRADRNPLPINKPMPCRCSPIAGAEILHGAELKDALGEVLSQSDSKNAL